MRLRERPLRALVFAALMCAALAGCRGLLGIDTDRIVTDDTAETGSMTADGAAEDSPANETSVIVDSGDPNAVGFRGQYGFVVDYACTDEQTARARIDTMVTTFGIREVQFYDWFASYSQPTSGDSWKDPWFHTREICLQTIKWYIDELHVKGGRAWAYVQSIASEDALSNPEPGVSELLDANGQWVYIGTHPTYFANAAWAKHQVDVWGQAVSALRFDGIHWDTIGPVAGDLGSETSGVHNFLATAKPLLAAMGLRQTMNFVNVSWWDDSLLDSVELPYFEVWTTAVEEGTLFDTMTSQPALASREAVMAFYPSVDKPDGWTESQTMIARWNVAPQHHLHYLVVGDGTDRLVTEYFPTAVPLTADEISALRLPAP